jgi:hypothetical protein
MTREITVSEVRAKLYCRPAGGGGEGTASTALLGQWFHEVFGILVDGEGSVLRGILTEANSGREDRVQAVRQYIYQRLIGPRLPHNHAALTLATEELLGFWQAVLALSQWLVDISDKATAAGESLDIAAEQDLSWELSDPNWTDNVRLVGRADGVVRRSGENAWCVIELKLGRGQPEADLGQACLYHAMLTAGQGVVEEVAASGGSLILMHFTPVLRSKVYAPDDLRKVLGPLKALVGEIAGVLSPKIFPSPIRQPVGITAAAISPTEAREVAGSTETRGLSPAPVHQGATSLPPPDPIGDPHRELARRLVRCCTDLGVPVRLGEGLRLGPSFLRIPLIPERGVSINRLASLAGTVQVHLHLPEPPIFRIDQGRQVADVQRPDRQPVLWRQYVGHIPAGDPLIGSAQVPVGVDLEGRLQFADLAKATHAHMLVAGTAGSGKSEWLRTALAGLMASNSPETLRLVLIDPKRLAFGDLRGSPYLWDEEALVFPDERDVNEVLDGLIEEMDARYRRMAAVGADMLTELARREGQPTPRIVCVCDEYADLLIGNKKVREEMESRIARLGSKARASGIHLILATQQPSRKTITGAIDTNMPCRVGLKTAKAIESKMLLDEAGAECLLGHGDLLFRDIGAARRLQAIFLPEEDRRRIFGGAARA